MSLRLETILAIPIALFVFANAHAQTMYSFDSDNDFLAPASSWLAWQNTLDRHQDERENIRRCLHSATACNHPFAGLKLVLDRGASLNREQQLRLVNRYINRQRYVDDRISTKSGAGNQWETLTEFLRSGGDCEDFAVAKYFILREFGVDADDMRIVIGKEKQRATHHAMLAIRFEDEVWLLENDNRIHRNGNQDINEFVYAINEHGIWDHEQKD